MCVYLHISIYIYIDTHTHTHTHFFIVAPQPHVRRTWAAIGFEQFVHVAFGDPGWEAGPPNLLKICHCDKKCSFEPKLCRQQTADLSDRVHGRQMIHIRMVKTMISYARQRLFTHDGYMHTYSQSNGLIVSMRGKRILTMIHKCPICCYMHTYSQSNGLAHEVHIIRRWKLHITIADGNHWHTRCISLAEVHIKPSSQSSLWYKPFSKYSTQSVCSGPCLPAFT